MPRPTVLRRGFVVATLVISTVATAPAATASGQGGDAVPVLTEVRIARHDTFDRVVFELGRAAPQATIDGPQPNRPGVVTADPSGFPIAVDGAQVLTVAMSPAIATYAASMPPGLLYSGPTSSPRPRRRTSCTWCRSVTSSPC